MRVMMKHQARNRFASLLATALAMQLWLPANAAEAKRSITAEANCVAEVALTTEQSYTNSFTDVTLDALVTAVRREGGDIQRMRGRPIPTACVEDCFRQLPKVATNPSFTPNCTDYALLLAHKLEACFCQ